MHPDILTKLKITHAFIIIYCTYSMHVHMYVPMYLCRSSYLSMYLNMYVEVEVPT